MTEAARRNPLKEAMQRGDAAVVLWVTTPWPGVTEIAGAAGADGVLVDLEHTSFSVPEAEEAVRAADAAGISAVVRTPSIDPATVSRILDAGAHGVIFPKVETADDAALAVRCCRYPPRGERGWGGAHTRYNRWTGGYARDLFGGGGERGVYSPEYVAEAEDRVLKIVLIETVRGVENADAILATEGVDAAIFGWGDFSVECGFDEDQCVEAAEAVSTACRRHGVALAVSGGSEAPPGGFVIAGIDSLILSAGIAAAIAKARGTVTA
jgi:2-keto-3-deoxy-L-rhamnonate aldolase RhmA